MVRHLDTAKEPSLQNLFKFRTKPKLVSQNINQTSRFCNKFYRFRTKLRGLVYFLRNQFRFCAKLKKVRQRRFFRCIQVKNHFRFCRNFLLHISIFQLIWKLFDIYRTFLRGLGKNLFFQRVPTTSSIHHLDFSFVFFLDLSFSSCMTTLIYICYRQNWNPDKFRI